MRVFNGLRNRWFPAWAALLAIAGIALVQFWPSESFSPGARFFTSFSMAGLCVIGCTVWLLFFSPFRWRTRFGILTGIIALLVALHWLIEPELTFDGEMKPIFARGRRSQLKRELDSHRASAAPAEATALPAITDSDFPEYRNARRDGIISGSAPGHEWQSSPPRLIWRQPCGGGYAGFVVVGPLAVTIEQRGPEEAIVGYDAETGRERWVTAYPADFREPLGGDGPRATPTISGDAIYSVGATGRFVCLDAATGRERWSADLLSGDSNVQWGQCGSPLVMGDMVIVTPGAQSTAAAGKAIRAFDCKTGKLIWASGSRRTGYSSPQRARIHGVEQIVSFDAEAVAGYDPRSGTELWSYPWPTYQGINVAQPLVFDDGRVFISAGYDAGCAMLQVKFDSVWSVDRVWQNKKLRCKFSSPVVRDGFIYGLDEAHLVCLDAKSGDRKWKGERYGFGQILLWGDAIVVGAENGRLALVHAAPDRFKELASLAALPGSKDWNHLAIARGRAYLRNEFEMACFELPLAAK